MKILRSISLLLALAFFTGAVAPVYASTEQDVIQNAFAKYNYAMNVEWDQENISFKDHAEMELSRSLNKVDPEELMAYTVNSISDSKAREDFIRLVNAMKAQNLSSKEAALIAGEWAEKTAASGVSFMGQGGGFRCNLVCKVIIVGVVVVVVKYLLTDNNKEEGRNHHHYDY